MKITAPGSSLYRKHSILNGTAINANYLRVADKRTLKYNVKLATGQKMLCTDFYIGNNLRKTPWHRMC